MLSIVPQHQWGQLFPAHPISWAQFRRVCACSCVHLCMLPAKQRQAERVQRTERGRKGIFWRVTQFRISSQSASCLLWTPAYVSISAPSHSERLCLSSRVGNSLDTIILAYGRGEIQEGVVCPWIAFQSPALHCFSWFIGRVFHQLIFLISISHLHIRSVPSLN